MLERICCRFFNILRAESWRLQNDFDCLRVFIRAKFRLLYIFVQNSFIFFSQKPNSNQASWTRLHHSPNHHTWYNRKNYGQTRFVLSRITPLTPMLDSIKYADTFFFIYLPECCNLSQDTPQSCWQSLLMACRKYIQWFRKYIQWFRKYIQWFRKYIQWLRKYIQWFRKYIQW